MDINSSIKKDVLELVNLVRLEEQFSAVVAQGLLQVDPESGNQHGYRQRRILELSRKFGLCE
ncbi:hypothetical protein [Pseudomonas fragariae (ex Marin et al. 2024)]|uniref:hypothetical protein n=1 Tax=Pseudomonas fragariae (ex Marin et al. 2024) TaxID=3080056 RepID=UPI003F7AF3FA